jgi:hypothetical protein
LEHLGLSPERPNDLEAIVEATMKFPTLPNMPFGLSAAEVYRALLEVHSLGLDVTNAVGEEAYQALHT